MIRIQNTQIFGFGPALHGMRNPMNSWARSDSTTKIDHQTWGPLRHLVPECPRIGPNDLKLMLNLATAGTEHRKFLRTIVIWTQIEPNRGCWQEIDTYKIATVRNSCSTMHKLGSRPLTVDDFQDGVVRQATLEDLNSLGERYRATKDYDLVIEMKRILPEGFLQLADYLMNYEVALTMFHQRRNHRLPEWRFTGGVNQGPDGRISICDWIYSLPYMAEIIQAIEKKQEERDERLREEGREEIRNALKMAGISVPLDIL